MENNGNVEHRMLLTRRRRAIKDSNQLFEAISLVILNRLNRLTAIHGLIQALTDILSDVVSVNMLVVIIGVASCMASTQNVRSSMIGKLVFIQLFSQTRIQ